MTRTLQFAAIIISIAITGAALAFVMSAQFAGASAPSGLSSTVATTGPMAVTGTQAVIIGTSTTCASRIISTQASGIMLTFSDINGKTPSATTGHWQAASTTVAYDSGLYGCGAVRAYSNTNQTLWVALTQ